MAVTIQEAKAELVERAAAQARARAAGGDAEQLEDFVRRYYEDVAPEDLADRTPEDLYGAAVTHWELLQERRPGEAKVRVYTPRRDEHGWQSTHSVVELVTDDMPFLVDSVSMAVTRHGSGIHLVVHPILRVRRDADGRLLELLPADSSEGIAESLHHVEIDRETDPEELGALTGELQRALADVRAAVEDWGEMRERAHEAIAELEERPPPSIDAEDVEEAKALLAWMADHHFTFLGYREYELREEDGEDVLSTVPGTGLGILREAELKPISHSFSELPPEVRRLARAPILLNLTKANSRATVHRPSYLDYVGVKRFDAQGNVLAERRFLGLYTSSAYSTSVFEIPLLRQKVRRVIERSGFVRGSHDHKAIVDTLENYPRDELFQISEDELFRIALDIVRLGERRRVRLFVRRDTFGRFLSALVFLPLDRYDTYTRRRIQRILQDAFGGVSVDWSARVSESVLARLHFVIYTTPGATPEYDVAEIEARIAEAARSWVDDLQAALVEQLGEERGSELFRRYGDAFPRAYRDDFPARAAVTDIERMETLDPAGDVRTSLYLPMAAPDEQLAFKLLRSGGALMLSDMLPLLENMGVKVTDERPYEIKPADREPIWIYDFGLVYAADAEFATDRLRQLFQETFSRVWRGQVENDGFNRLVLAAGLTWRQVGLMRAVSRYLRQAGTTFSNAYMEETLARHPEVAARLVELFERRFDPARRAGAEERAAALVAEIRQALDAVASLDEDRILRSFLGVVRAMLRTNYFQDGPDGKPYLSFKLDPSRVPELPQPRPLYEIFVYSPRVEGIHLRGGKVARGGIRWSDRREDFRTEVLGLMKAQTVKNAVIVPVGAKGGFVVKQPPAGRDELRAEVEACYRLLVRGLLDVTDTLVAGEIVPPADVVRYDEDDPYLVVAADKGTATFSDVANELAAEYGFWLGDAFASGGSTGYDHKKIGITSRGAWESVRRHFRALGVNADTEELTVVGIGDMSGDVFGNGLLRSPHLKLLAAFDHRHVFLDPDPDPAASYAERLRLFELPGSSWADYDPALISGGGGVFPRTAKSVPLSPQAQAALGVEAASLTPNELIQAVLRAPVDLLWNGGIGTFVKAPDESHAQVGDRSSDAIRVNADELRVRVVGEGGNLGFTQRARIAYALRGGRIYMDAIDNSAGVDCSDHEVNIKILLQDVVAEGLLTEEQRVELLRAMTDEVAELVLRDNYEQTQAIEVSLAQAASMVDAHGRHIRRLEQDGRLRRALESLPSDETLVERKAAGIGLTAPEIAVLVSYTKNAVYDALLESDVPDEPALARELERYFPTAVRDRFRAHAARHPLRREIVVAQLANELVNRGGATFAFRLGEETGASVPDIARAFAVARDVFGLREIWSQIEALDDAVPAQTQTAMLIRARTLLERGTRWLLRNRPRPLGLAAAVAELRPGVEAVAEALPELLAAASRQEAERVAAGLVAEGVPGELADRVSRFSSLFLALDVVDLATARGADLETVGQVHFGVGEALDLHWLRERIGGLPREERWDALARRALWEDLFAQHRALTAEVLRTAGDVPAWAAANERRVERCAAVLSEVKSGGTFDLATLSVAVREIQNLAEASS